MLDASLENEQELIVELNQRPDLVVMDKSDGLSLGRVILGVFG